jgi:hypothetical protein
VERLGAPATQPRPQPHIKIHTIDNNPKRSTKAKRWIQAKVATVRIRSRRGPDILRSHAGGTAGIPQWRSPPRNRLAFADDAMRPTMTSRV